MSRRVHYTTVARVEEITEAGGYQAEVGRDNDGEYLAVVTREFVEFRGRLTAVAS